MTNCMRIVTGLLAALLALSGAAVAQGQAYGTANMAGDGATGDAMAYADETTAHGDAAGATDAGAAAAEAGAYDDGNYVDGDARAATEAAGAAADTDASVAESDDARGPWAWLSVGFQALVQNIASALGLAAGDAAGVDAGADAWADKDGVDLDANVQAPCVAPAPCDAVTFDGAPVAGQADDMSYRALDEVERLAPELPG